VPTPIARASVPDLVFAELCEAILSGQYAAGERMPTQRQLAAELAVNMASVREALGRLEQLRLIEVRHGDATRVLDWRNSGGLEALAVLGSTDRDTMADLFEARRLLLVQSARLACERRSPEQVDQLSELAGVIQSAEEDSVALLADWSYMATLVQAAGNLILQLIMNSVRELYLPSMEKFTAVVSERARLAPLYERAARAIAARDADAAAEAIASLSAAQEASMLRGS
jgi:DNA-binding FadR family transcriptional regulator